MKFLRNILEIKLVEVIESVEWDEFVNRVPEGTVFHRWRWLKQMETHSGCQLLPLVGYFEGKIVGVFPIFYQKKGFFRAIYSPPPRMAMPYLGPLTDLDELRQDEREKLVFEFINLVNTYITKKINPAYIYFSFVPEFIDVRQFKWDGYLVEPVYNYQLDLKNEKETIFKAFRRSVKKSINKEKKRLVITKGNMGDLKKIFTAIEGRYADQKMSLPFDFDYVRDICVDFKNNIDILVAKEDDKFIGGALKISFQNKSLDWIGDTKNKDYSVNELLHWRAIENAMDQSKTIYEFVGANTPRLLDFKAKFNPALVVGFSAKKANLIGLLVEKLYFLFAKRKF